MPASADEMRARAYPRRGGETTFEADRLKDALGLSPRRRGNHDRLLRQGYEQGPIPAQAGEPRRLAV